MKKIIGMLLIAAITVFPVIGEEEEEVTNADIVASIEKINEKLEWMFDKVQEAAKDEDKDDKKYETDGGLFFPVRYLLEGAKLNTFFTQQGSYTADSLLIPVANGGGFTFKSFFESTYFGMTYSGYGISSRGFQTHQTAAEQPNITVDENSDGFHDFYSFANYGIGSFMITFGAKADVSDSVRLTGGLGFGPQREEFSIAKTSLTRNWFTNALGIIGSENPDWTRYSLVVGGNAGIMFRLGAMEIKLEGGFDYVPLKNAWEPSGGIHRTASAPPADFNTMNGWGTIDFNFKIKE